MSLQDVGVLVALVGVIGGFYLTWRGQKQDRRISEATAQRSEAAASLTADNTERVLIALETIAAKDLGATVIAAPVPPRVRWRLANHGGDTYALTNEGDATAYAVEVSAHESMGIFDRASGGDDLAPGEAMTFFAVLTMGTSDSTITVSWLAESNGTDRHEWRYPLPPRPPRTR